MMYTLLYVDLDNNRFDDNYIGHSYTVDNRRIFLIKMLPIWVRIS